MTRKSVYVVLIFISGFAVGWGLHSTGISRHIWALSEKTIQENFTGLQKRMAAYHREFNQYSSDLATLGFETTGSHIVVYTDVSQVPAMYQKRLLPDELPVTKADSYLALLVATDLRSGEISFWLGDETGEFEKLALKLSSDLLMLAD